MTEQTIQQSTASTAAIILPSPIEKVEHESASKAPELVLQNADTDTLAITAKTLLDAVQAAKLHADLPQVQQHNPDTSNVGYYLQSHAGKVLRGLDTALRDVQLTRAEDIDLLMRGFLIRLLNRSIYSKHTQINQAVSARDSRDADAKGAELVKSITAFMLAQKMQEKFTPSEIELIKEHATAGRTTIAANLAGEDVSFLLTDTDWKVKADDMASVPGSRNVTASIEPVEAGNSVAVQFSNGGWRLAWWNSADNGNGDNPGWVVIQCSDNIKEQVHKEREQQREFDKALGRTRPVMQSKVFTDELA